MTTRRRFLGSLGSSIGAALIWPQITVAATGSDTRFLLVLLRGGLDGLHALPPYADPGYAALRGGMALSPGSGSTAIKLDGTFALHPALAFSGSLYARKEFLPVVAVAPPYWGRSHFDAQDCVENGTATPHGAQTGWLNRCITAMPGVKGLAAASVMPLAMRGGANVETWTPPLSRRIDPVLLQHLEVLYAADPRLDTVFRRAVESSPNDEGIPPAHSSNEPTDAVMTADGTMKSTLDKPAGIPGSELRENDTKKDAGGSRLVQMMRAVGGLMARPDGPRVAFVEDTGWDTHANEAAILARKLAELDAALHVFHDAVGAVWRKTVVAVVTEFGRTAAINGTGGTDHGSGGVMFLAGGAVRGGRIAGDWPGLAPTALYEHRDVRATSDLRAIFKGVLASHLGVSQAALSTSVFPDGANVRPADGLIETKLAAV